MQTIDQTLLYILLLTIVSLVLLGIGLIIVYVRSVRKYNELRDKRETDQPEANPQAVLASAQSKSQQILQDASRRAEEIVGKAQIFTNDQENRVAAEIEKAAQMYAASYKESLQQLEGKAVTMMQSVPEEVKQVLLKEVTNIRTTMQSQVQQVQTDAKQIVLDAYKKAEEEVVNYRKQRIKQVDESIVIILQDIARKVLSKEISKEEHEKLVMKALEDAKRSGAFGMSLEMTQSGNEISTDEEAANELVHDSENAEVENSETPMMNADQVGIQANKYGQDSANPADSQPDTGIRSGTDNAGSVPEGYSFADPGTNQVNQNEASSKMGSINDNKTETS